MGTPLSFGALIDAPLPGPGPYLLDLPDGLDAGTLPAILTALAALELRGQAVHDLSPAGEELVVGRSGVDVNLGSPTASRRHASLRHTARGLVLADLESVNGTRVDGERVRTGVATTVAPGQVISFGQHRALLLDREQLAELLAARSERVAAARRDVEAAIATPPEGRPLRDLIARVGALPPDPFLELCQAAFLLQIPVVPSEGTPEDPLDGTISISQTRILALQRSRDVRQALVHVVSPASGGVTVGRDAGCELVLPEPTVSKRHAELHRSPNGWRLIDLDSQNGTYLEGKRLPPRLAAPLQAGNSVRFSSYLALWLSAEAIHQLLFEVAARRIRG